MPLSQGQGALLGACICIVANTLISLALNVQKLAHVRMQGKLLGEGEAGGGEREEEQGADGDGDESTRETPEQRHDEESGGEEEEEEEGGAQPNTRFLKSKLWWSGIGLMLLGEMGNFISYGFAPASLVAPLGSVALLANVFLAPLILKERFASSDLFGVFLATVGAAGVVAASSTGGGEGGPGGPGALWEAIKERDFLLFTGVMIGLGMVLVGLSTTRWGERYVLVDVGACAVFGGFTVLSTKGISSILSYGASKGDILSALKSPVSYGCVVVLVATALVQITFLNRALQRFDARKVIPSQFVLFTISSISGSAVLFRDFERADATHLIGFFAACATTFAGVFVLTRHKGEHGGHGKEGGDGEEHEEDAQDGPAVESRQKTGWSGRGRQSGTDEERQPLLDPSTPVRAFSRSEANKRGLTPRRPGAPPSAVSTGSMPTYASMLTPPPRDALSPASAAGLPIRHMSKHRHASSSSSSSVASSVAGNTPRDPNVSPLSTRSGGGGFLRTPRLSLARGSSATGAGGYLLLLSGSSSGAGAGAGAGAGTGAHPAASPSAIPHAAASNATDGSGPSLSPRPAAATAVSPIHRSTVGLSVSPGRALLHTGGSPGGVGWGGRGQTQTQTQNPGGGGAATPTRSVTPSRGGTGGGTAGLKHKGSRGSLLAPSERERERETRSPSNPSASASANANASASASAMVAESAIEEGGVEEQQQQQQQQRQEAGSVKPALSTRRTVEVIPQVGSSTGGDEHREGGQADEAGGSATQR